MIIIKKQYEIEDNIQGIDENNNILYEFKMQLTDEDIDKLQKALFGEETLKLAKKIKEMEYKELTEEEEKQITDMGKQLNLAAENLIDELCFKEHKEPFIKVMGEIKYREMKEMISDYLISFFTNRQVSRINIINSDLAKISEK